MIRLVWVLCALIGISGAALAADLPPSPPRAPAVYVPAVVPVYTVPVGTPVIGGDVVTVNNRDVQTLTVGINYLFKW